MILIPILLALLTLTAGMFLLAKTRKEELGKFFEAISFFIIIASFVLMALTIIGGFTRMIFHRMYQERRHSYMMGEESWRRGRLEHHRGGGRMHHRWREGSEEMHGEYHEHKLDPQVQTDKMAEKLGLNEEQKAKVLALNTEVDKKIETLREEKREKEEGGEELQLHDEWKKIEEEKKAKLKTILTNEQFQKYNKIVEEKHKRREEKEEKR